MIIGKEKYGYPLLFFGVVLGYMMIYAGAGINDTDGGFITAYAWRILQGELPYTDFIYVRPPVSLWLRSAELWLLPDTWELLAERWLFYGKLGLYSYLAAAIVLRGRTRWLLATLGFMVSAHNYPAAAWHTVDGILLAVIGFWLFFQKKNWGWLGGAIFVLLAALCKQSFYPVLPLFLIVVGIHRGGKVLAKASLALLLSAGLFGVGIQQAGIGDAFFAMTTGATSSGQALQRGLYDYQIISWSLLALALILLPFFINIKDAWLPAYWQRKRWILMAVFITLLLGAYGYAIYSHGYFTPPVEMSRLLFVLAFAYLMVDLARMAWTHGWITAWEKLRQAYIQPLALLGIAWMSAISWGYNFPVLFATPMLFPFFLMVKNSRPNFTKTQQIVINLTLIIAVAGVFRYAYEYVYRQGKRSELTYAMENVFPKLRGIYSNQKTYEKYMDLKKLHQKYGASFKTLPAFPLSNYLTNTQSPLPIDWIFNSETNGKNQAIYKAIQEQDIYFFIERDKEKTIRKNPKYEVSKYVLEQLQQIEETPYFWVFKK